MIESDPDIDTDDKALWAAIMNDETIDEVSARLKEDGRVHLKWRYANGPYHYRWFDFSK